MARRIMTEARKAAYRGWLLPFAMQGVGPEDAVEGLGKAGLRVPLAPAKAIYKEKEFQERVRGHIERMTLKAMAQRDKGLVRQLEDLGDRAVRRVGDVLVDPEAPHMATLKAAELVLKHQPELQRQDENTVVHKLDSESLVRAMAAAREMDARRGAVDVKALEVQE